LTSHIALLAMIFHRLSIVPFIGGAV